MQIVLHCAAKPATSCYDGILAIIINIYKNHIELCRVNISKQLKKNDIQYIPATHYFPVLFFNRNEAFCQGILRELKRDLNTFSAND